MRNYDKLFRTPCRIFPAKFMPARPIETPAVMKFLSNNPTNVQKFSQK